MSVQIDVQVDADLDLQSLERDANAVLVAAGRADAELSLVLVDDAAMRPLNRDWRGKDSATDVLSFPQEGIAGVPLDLLGDVVISVDTASRQAQERGHGLEVELRVLLVHGVAHLLGHDHLDPDEALAMRAVERSLLGALLGRDAPAGLVEAALG